MRRPMPKTDPEQTPPAPSTPIDVSFGALSPSPRQKPGDPPRYVMEVDTDIYRRQFLVVLGRYVDGRHEILRPQPDGSLKPEAYPEACDPVYGANEPTFRFSSDDLTGFAEAINSRLSLYIQPREARELIDYLKAENGRLQAQLADMFKRSSDFTQHVMKQIENLTQNERRQLLGLPAAPAEPLTREQKSEEYGLRQRNEALVRELENIALKLESIQPQDALPGAKAILNQALARLQELGLLPKQRSSDFEKACAETEALSDYGYEGPPLEAAQQNIAHRKRLEEDPAYRKRYFDWACQQVEVDPAFAELRAQLKDKDFMGQWKALSEADRLRIISGMASNAPGSKIRKAEAPEADAIRGHVGDILLKAAKRQKYQPAQFIRVDEAERPE